MLGCPRTLCGLARAATAEPEQEAVYPEVEDAPGDFGREVLFYRWLFVNGQPGTLHGFFWGREWLEPGELTFAGERCEIRFRRIWGVAPRRRRP